MTKSELVSCLVQKQAHLSRDDIDKCVDIILECITKALAHSERIEIRGFGSFALNHRSARVGRNPKTGAPVEIPGRRVPHFKPGKEMRGRLLRSAQLS